MKRSVILASCLAAGAAFAAEPAASATVAVDPAQELGPVKPMHAVNNGPTVPPVRGDQKRGNFLDYKAARLPFARTHDSINCVSGGAHACDISAVFPDFDADENDPRNYDFVFTDHYLNAIRRAGTEVFFRLGQTIEHGPKKYGVLPPRDFAKWARICEHVIRHYNEGWGWGVDTARTTRNVEFANQFNIVYWEIWNEPDLDPADDVSKNVSPRCWGGTTGEFFQFFEIAAKHLKGRFPDLKIGGPAIAGNEKWGERFLAYAEAHKVPLDFFSWHCYAREPGEIAAKAGRVRKMLDSHGYSGAESILNEWNYVKGWVDDWVYTLRAESGDLNLKGAAFIASALCAGQCSPVDMLMYYDARSSTAMNGMFERVTLWPMKAYYPFFAWSRLADLGVQTQCRVSGKGFYAVAAKGRDGSGAALVARYSNDDNVSDIAKVALRVDGKPLTRARCHLTDLVRTYTEVPLELEDDGSAVIRMQPLSFALIEW